jgi:hypothetical protein
MQNHLLRLMSVLLALAACTFVVAAQSDDHPDTSNTSAKNASFDPRDLTGIWDTAAYLQPKDEVHPMGRGGMKPPFTPAGQARFDQNVKFIASGAVLDCDPLGTSRSLLSPRAFEVFVSRGRIIQHFEYYDGWREIWMDGRKMPADEDIDPSYWGYSVGKWDGNAFVVQTAGFNGLTFLSSTGFPMSDAMHQTERWERVDHDTLKIALTFNDPKMYTQPWTATYFYKAKPAWELERAPCTIRTNKDWDTRMGRVDGLSGSDYKSDAK